MIISIQLDWITKHNINNAKFYQWSTIYAYSYRSFSFSRQNLINFKTIGGEYLNKLRSHSIRYNALSEQSSIVFSTVTFFRNWNANSFLIGTTASTENFVKMFDKTVVHLYLNWLELMFQRSEWVCNTLHLIWKRISFELSERAVSKAKILLMMTKPKRKTGM